MNNDIVPAPKQFPPAEAPPAEEPAPVSTPVNDVVAAPTAPEPQEPQQEVVSSPEEQTSDVAEAPETPPADEKPAEEEPEKPHTEDVADGQEVSVQTKEPAKEPAPEAVQQTAAQKPKNTSSKPIVAIVLAFVVCAALIGVAVYATMASSKTAKTSDTTKLTAPGSEQPSDSPATVKPDVQGALTETDTLPNPNDDPGAQLSDAALGL